MTIEQRYTTVVFIVYYIATPEMFVKKSGFKVINYGMLFLYKHCRLQKKDLLIDG